MSYKLRIGFNVPRECLDISKTIDSVKVLFRRETSLENREQALCLIHVTIDGVLSMTVSLIEYGTILIINLHLLRSAEEVTCLTCHRSYTAMLDETQ